jgi:hypothetical protein
MVDEPQAPGDDQSVLEGGTVAAPAFKRIAQGILQVLHVLADRPRGWAIDCSPVEFAALCTDAGVASRVVGEVAGIDVVDIAYRSERSGLIAVLRCAAHAPTARTPRGRRPRRSGGAGRVRAARRRSADRLPDARTGMARLADALYGHPSGGSTGGAERTAVTTTSPLAPSWMPRRPCGLTEPSSAESRRREAVDHRRRRPDPQRAWPMLTPATRCAMEASSIATPAAFVMRVRRSRLY